MAGDDQGQGIVDESDEIEALELVLFQVPECYVYLVSDLRFQS